MTKNDWIAEVLDILVDYYYKESDAVYISVSLYETYYEDGYTPLEAVLEELSYN